MVYKKLVTWSYFLADDEYSKSTSNILLSKLESNQNNIDNLSDFTNDDLYTVFNFCKLLPRLEEIGKVRQKKKCREICAKLIDMLQPMFKKKMTL